MERESTYAASPLIWKLIIFLFRKLIRKQLCSKPFNMEINLLFCFASSFAVQLLLFEIMMTQEILKGEVGNGE